MNANIFAMRICGRVGHLQPRRATGKMKPLLNNPTK
jgi:hypothetical protein